MEESSQKKEMLIEFLQCAAMGDMEEILTTLMCHPDLINAENSESGDTALVVAARENQPEVIAILLDHGADVTLCNYNCQTALHIANDGIRAHLLSAVKRTSYPQLALAQAAWQGDLDTIQDFLSADSCQDVNTINVQGLTPLMLVVRDVDLFEGLTMECNYKPVSVLEELLRHHGDAHLLDLNENSAMSYASQVKSPIREQLMDLLEKSPPPPETLDEDFCGFCPDTKTSLFDRTASTPDRADSQNTHSGKEPLCDGIIVEDISQEPEAEVPICPEAGEAGDAPVYDLENNTMDERKKNFLAAQWLPDFSPEHLTSRPSIRKNPSLPPLYVKKEEKDVQLERLGLGYLLKGSHSDPNIPEAPLEVDPLRNLRYIKDHIKQRLSLSESPGKSKTFPPIYYSPLSPKSYKLRPLLKTSSSNSLTERSITILNSEKFDKSKDNRLTCKHGSVGKPVDGLDLVLSKDQVQISLVSVTSSESVNHTSDMSRSAHSGIRLASGRREDQGSSTNHNNTSLPQIFSKLPELHTNGKNGKTPRSSWREKTHSSFESEPLAVQESHKTVGEIHNDSKDNELVTNCDQDLLKDQTDLLHSSMPNKNSKDNIKMPLNHNRLPYVSKVIESIKNNSPRTPRASYVPFVQITFSEQEAETEAHYPPVKQSLVKGKPNLSILTHVSRSFNINAQKENDKSKKTNIRSNSATNLKFSRPLSNRNSGKRVPLPTLAYSSGPSPSRLSKKGRPKQGSAERNSQRSQTQLSLYTKKRPKSPVNPAMALRAKSADDFQDIHYSDMFFEIKSQNNGPGIFQMFESPVYIKCSKDDRKGRKEAGSASSTRSCSSKGIRSRDSSARSSKSTKPGNRKKSSATSSRRKNLLTKSVAAEDISEKNKDNQVIISGTDWEIKTIKDERNVIEINTDKLKNLSDLPHQDFADLSIIKEATIENSLTGNQAAQTIFIKMFQEVGQVNHIQSLKKEHVDLVTPEERNGIENVGPQVKIKSSEKDEEQRGHISEAGDVGLPPQISATRRPSEGLQLSLGKATLNNLNSREKNEEEILIEDRKRERSHQLYSTSIPMNSKHNSGTSDMLISFKRYLEQIDEQSKSSKTMENQDNDQSVNIDCKQHADKSGRKINSIQINRCTSPTDSETNNSNQSGNYFNTSNDSSIYWIKGEVLGRGAYGTVYKGLTSEGELIAAKQVTLHASDSNVAEKEYKKLQEEVDLLKTLKHDNIVGYLGTCLQDNIVTIFMEYVPGGSMANILRDFGPLQEAVISKFTNHILQGIAYLHKNRVVHRDIKGNNVMLMPNGVIKLIDFGCAKRLNGLSMNSSRREMLKSMHGTPYWMAPEVISESGHGEKSDIWSIGCTVFEMATGKPPLAHMNRLAAMFYIAGHKGFMPTLPDPFSKKARDFVNLCLIREQEERPSAEQLLQHSFTREKTPPQKPFQPPEDA